MIAERLRGLVKVHAGVTTLEPALGLEQVETRFNRRCCSGARQVHRSEPDAVSFDRPPPMAKEPQGHHYVPQFLLGNFAFHEGKKGKGSNRVWVFDKWERRHFPGIVRDVAKQRLFNEIELAEFNLTLEPDLSKVESRASSVIGRVLAGRALANLNPDERWHLAYFAAIQQLRGPQSTPAASHDSEARVAIAKALLRSAPPQQTDSAALIREDRLR